MKQLLMAKTSLALLLALTFAVACKQESSAPAPLPIEQVPAALLKAFTKAKPEAKELVNQIVGALQAQDYSKAYLELQNLAARSGLDKEQQSITGRSVLTVNGLLQQAAQTKGDTKAAETLKTYRINK
jgi:hypothetical protein